MFILWGNNVSLDPLNISQWSLPNLLSFFTQRRENSLARARQMIYQITALNENGLNWIQTNLLFQP